VGGWVTLVGGESAVRLSAAVWGRVPVSADIRTRSGAEWRAPPPLDVLRMAAWIS